MAGIESQGATVVGLVRAERRRRMAREDFAAHGVIAAVGVEFGVTADLLLHPSRCRAEIARARMIAMYLCCTLLGRTFAAVGNLFGRDRTTVSHACAKVEDWREKPAFDARIARIEAAIAAPTVGTEREAHRAAG